MVLQSWHKRHGQGHTYKEAERDDLEYGNWTRFLSVPPTFHSNQRKKEKQFRCCHRSVRIMMLLHFRVGPSLYVIRKWAIWAVQELEAPQRLLPPFEGEPLQRARTSWLAPRVLVETIYPHYDSGDHPNQKSAIILNRKERKPRGWKAFHNHKSALQVGERMETKEYWKKVNWRYSSDIPLSYSSFNNVQQPYNQH